MREGREEPSEQAEQTARAIVDAALFVHRTLGPGLLEAIYETCLAAELQRRGHRVDRQLSLPVTFNGQELESAYRLDLMINDLVIVEVKAVETLIPLHEAQLLTYLRLSGRTLGLVINFNTPLIKDGIRRKVLSPRVPS